MRIGDSVYYCKKLATKTDNQFYSAPTEIVTRVNYFTVMGKSGYSDIIEFGENISSYLTAIAQPYDMWKDEFKAGDLFYCNGVEPNSAEDWYGQKANFVVDYVDYGNMRIKLTLKKVRE